MLNIKALNTKRQSGGGRIITTSFDICNNGVIWSGSPTTEFIESELKVAILKKRESNKLKKILLNL